MPTTTILWFALTLVLFAAFMAWVIHEIRSVGHRHISKSDVFSAEADEE
jgi:hypothetical protein